MPSLAGGAFVTAGEAGSNREARLGGVGQMVAGELEARTGKEWGTESVSATSSREGGDASLNRQSSTHSGTILN
jgi:hypothetical protein